MLPLKEFFEQDQITWSGVYYHHYKWVKDGSWQRVWIELLKTNHNKLDLSSVQLDGSQTLCKKQGEHRGYQARKAAYSTNALLLADNKGVPLALATPQAGNHHDLFQI